MPPAATLAGVTRAAPDKYEIIDGKVFVKPIESPRHYALCVATGIVMHEALHERACVTFSSDQRIGVGGGHAYPDVRAVSGEVALEDGRRDLVTNPRILVEVLSAATERHDRGRKWLAYQRLPSLGDYLLVSQSEVRIEHYRRAAGGRWSYRASGPGERVELTDGPALFVDAIFAGVSYLPGE
jgi:Uma2 family endonuclease